MSVTDKNGNTTHYNYDKESRTPSVEYPSGLTMKYKYDKKDNLLEKTRNGIVIGLKRTDVDIKNFDLNSGQGYMRALVSGNQTRFTGQDPAGMQEGPNIHQYVGNNPLNHRDSTGLSDNFNLCMNLCSMGGCAAAVGVHP